MIDSKFHQGQRIVWHTGCVRGESSPHGKISDGPIEKAVNCGRTYADKYTYIVLLDSGGAYLLGESCLNPECEERYCQCCGAKIHKKDC